MTQLSFVPGRGSTDAIFVVWWLHVKYLALNSRFVNLNEEDLT